MSKVRVRNEADFGVYHRNNNHLGNPSKVCKATGNHISSIIISI